MNMCCGGSFNSRLLFNRNFHWKIFSIEFRGNFQERLHCVVMALTYSIVVPVTSFQMELFYRAQRYLKSPHMYMDTNMNTSCKKSLNPCCKWITTAICTFLKL